MAEAWKRIDPTTTTKVDRRTVVIKTFEMPDGQTHPFATFNHETLRCAAVIALTPDNRVVVARQFRPGPEKIMDELPGGGVEDGEDPQAAAERELLEETGYVPEHMEPLGTSTRDAYTNGTWYYYLATGCTLSAGGQQLDDQEYVDSAVISIDQFLANAREDRMTDTAAVVMAYERLLQLRA